MDWSVLPSRSLNDTPHIPLPLSGLDPKQLDVNGWISFHWPRESGCSGVGSGNGSNVRTMRTRFGFYLTLSRSGTYKVFFGRPLGCTFGGLVGTGFSPYTNPATS